MQGLFSPANLQHMALAGLYSIGGIIVFAASFWAIDKMTPGSLWKELVDEHNTAVAVLFGCWAVGLAIIIAAAIHTN